MHDMHCCHFMVHTQCMAKKLIHAYFKYVWIDNVINLVVRMEEGLRSGAQSESSCSAS